MHECVRDVMGLVRTEEKRDEVAIVSLPSRLDRKGHKQCAPTFPSTETTACIRAWCTNAIVSSDSAPPSTGVNIRLLGSLFFFLSYFHTIHTYDKKTLLVLLALSIFLRSQRFDAWRTLTLCAEKVSTPLDPMPYALQSDRRYTTRWLKIST